MVIRSTRLIDLAAKRMQLRDAEVPPSDSDDDQQLQTRRSGSSKAIQMMSSDLRSDVLAALNSEDVQ